MSVRDGRHRTKLEVLGDRLRRMEDVVLVRGGSVVPNIGERVYNERAQVVGYVTNVFGPVSRFYVAVRVTKRDRDDGVYRVLRET
ncbi:MAG: hypothetical protein NZ920_03235 [Aigarchaeota archaeon]|nr:hypothetical protein [Aigarchaeota archaeon]MDW8092368.1 hypothetical protein [Nitrososphaerota archaeon]